MAAGEGAPRGLTARPLVIGRRLRLLGAILAVAVAYAVIGKLSLGLAFVDSSVTAVWPPSGIAVAALLFGGVRLWPGVALGALAANLLNGSSPATSALIMVGNTAAPVVAVLLVRLATRRRQVSLDSVAAVLALICVGGLVSMTVSATLGTVSLVVTGALPMQRFTTVWPTWWIGDAMGVVLGAP